MGGCRGGLVATLACWVMPRCHHFGVLQFFPFGFFEHIAVLCFMLGLALFDFALQVHLPSFFCACSLGFLFVALPFLARACHRRYCLASTYWSRAVVLCCRRCFSSKSAVKFKESRLEKLQFIIDCREQPKSAFDEFTSWLGERGVRVSELEGARGKLDEHVVRYGNMLFVLRAGHGVIRWWW